MAEENKNSDFSFEEDDFFFENYKPKNPVDDVELPEFQSTFTPKEEKGSFIKSIFEWLDVVVASVLVVVILFTFVFRMVAIDGESMLPTLVDKERVIISDLFYEPKRGDIVVISRNKNNSPQVGTYEEPIIKRVIATEGETVDIDFETGIVYVNGVALSEDYTLEPTYRKMDVEFPLMVKEDCVFVLGDNRNDSLDSRSSTVGDNGQINEKYILGRAIIRVFPINKFGGIN